MDTLAEAVAFYHSLQRFGIRPGLERISVLCSLLGHPEKGLRYVHVAGTNGKGSVCTEIANVLRCAGYRTGLYTSPYVLDFRERIQVDNLMISPEDLIGVTRVVRNAVDALNAQGECPTEFEAVTAAAFLYFARQKCDCVVLETGLGGRFDATNLIVSPIVSVITSVSYDHMNVLGDTLSQIAFEKCGIIKPRTFVVTPASQPEEALEVIRSSAKEKNAFLFEAAAEDIFTVLGADITGTAVRYRGAECRIPFMGGHQVQNAALSVKACEILGVNGYDITPSHVRQGIEASFVPARTEILQSSPLIVLDGSHNEDSTRALADALHTYLPDRRILAVMGMMEDKDCEKSVRNFTGIFHKVIAVRPSNPRSMQADAFASLLRSAGFTAEHAPSPEAGIDLALEELSQYDALVVCGSLYLASDVRTYLISRITDR